MARRFCLILSHWHKLFEGFQQSPQQIYSLLEEAIDKWKIPDVKISQISSPEVGALSARKEYPQVERKDHIIDICATPLAQVFLPGAWDTRRRYIGCRIQC